MKTAILLSFFVGTCATVAAQSLPGPPANLQTLPSGSLVIPMDNTLQANAAGLFNLKAYGLIVHLLNNNIKVKWVIKAGKTKDAIDFTVSAEQLKPTLIAGGLSRDFRSGPFVIFAADIANTETLMDNFYTANNLTGNNRPNVYRTTAATTVDIRYNLTGFYPKAAILTDGGNQAIHLAYMTAASIPTTSYSTSTGSNLIGDCYTFASEPHNSNTGTVVNAAISAIKDFVSNGGGNFLAQCEAVPNYENNSLGRFQTTTGITVGSINFGTSVSYPNPDLSFSQFEGAYNATNGGSVRTWQINGAGANNEHNQATGTGTNSNLIGASVSKFGSGIGGMVFYLGNHTFKTNVADEVNGIRMYMNAFLTPPRQNCASNAALPLNVRFAGSLQKDQARLQWNVSENQSIASFEVQKSISGGTFATIHTFFATANAGSKNYQYTDPLHITDVTSYRLKIVHTNNQVTFSNVIRLKGNSQAPQPGIVLLQNPVQQTIRLTYHSPENGVAAIAIYNSAGFKVYTGKAIMVEGQNILNLNLKNDFAGGSYIFEITGNSCRQTALFVKQ